MSIPFTSTQFCGVFTAYNTGLRPVQVFLLALGVIAIALLVVQGRYSNAGISAVLMGLWAWQALAYHLAFFAAINSLAYVFAALFLCGAAVFFWQGVVWRKMNFRITSGWRMWAAWGLILAGVIGIVLLIRSKPAATRLVAAS